MGEHTGTALTVRFSRVVDGDTIRVFLPDADKDESLRILSLDTEESNAGGGKPVTPLGKKAKEFATQVFADTSEVTIEFPGTEPLEVCLKKYRGNYGRLLVHVYRGETDYQELMITEGYSPYFNKYGNATFAANHRRYINAERQAQAQRLGVWDQITNNGSEMRNYAALATWWQLRADVIDGYRSTRAIDETLLNTRLDYHRIDSLARQGKTATIFTELSRITRIGGNHALVGIGSNEQPFSLFIPDVDSDAGQQIVQLMESRYTSGGETRPRRSYAYVTGELSVFRDRPQMVLTEWQQVTDRVPFERADADALSIRIASVLPNPEGSDRGNEKLTLKNLGNVGVPLAGWTLRDRGNAQLALSGEISASGTKELTLPASGVSLNNRGDELTLTDANGKVRDTAKYAASDVAPGRVINLL